MAKYIVNIILVTACLFTYTSCIRKMNLYDENRNTGQDNNEKDTDSTPVYMYPFDKETANVTAEIIIHTKKEIQTKDINVEIPHLKYNKTWMLMLTQDDCMQAAFCRTWAAINGKPISSSIPYPTPTPTDQNMKHQLYFDIKHLQKGDLPPTIISANQSLGCTDGAGNEVRFAITTTLAPEEKWMDAETNVLPGFTANYYRFYMKSGLIWDNIREMLNYGTGIALHDVMTKDANDPIQILEHFDIAQNIIVEKLTGRGCKFLAEPNGNKTYVTAALQCPEIQTMTAQAGAITLYPYQVSETLQKSLIEREFNDSPAYFKQQITDLLKLPKEERKAICIGVHGTDNNWIDFLLWLNSNYGKDGDDSLWFPSQEEYYEYNYYRLNSHISIVQIDASSFKLTVNLPGEKFFYYPSTTINLPGISMYDIVSIEGNDALTGLSYADYKDGIMLNIDCRKYLFEHAENFVKRYEANPSDASNKADALYFVNMLKESAKKEALKKRLQ